MCGIVGYIGSDAATPFLLKALRRLEYRGYDSVGIATISRHGVLDIVKTAGRIDNLMEILPDDPPTSRVGIGHTRWATHGAPTSKNAHPHVGGVDSIAIVHNGVIANHDELREQLKSQGYEFCSDTDSEVIAHQIHRHLYGPERDPDASTDAGRTAISALHKAVQSIHGSYAVVVLLREQPDMLLAARHGRPLVIGAVADGYVVGSDLYALSEHATELTRLGDGEFTIIQNNTAQIFTRYPDRNVTHHGTVVYRLSSVN
ncbi:MAG: class II glutamine amidotransferase [Fuerstiella sp.]